MLQWMILYNLLPQKAEVGLFVPFVHNFHEKLNLNLYFHVLMFLMYSNLKQTKDNSFLILFCQKVVRSANYRFDIGIH